MNSQNKLFIITKYALVYFAGILTGAVPFLNNISELPASIEKFRETYLYEKDFLSGTWSTDAEYVLNAADMGLDTDQPNIVLDMNFGDKGFIQGSFLSEGICDYAPITWIITIESESPSLHNLLLDRKFQVKQIHNGKMEKIADLKLTNLNMEKHTIEFTVTDDFSKSLPKKIILGKDLPKAEENREKLENYCAESLGRVDTIAILRQ